LQTLARGQHSYLIPLFGKLIVTHNLGYWTRGVRADVEQS